MNESEKPDDSGKQSVFGRPEYEQRWHGYVGNRIPWYVRTIWLLFWAFAVYYAIAYLFPALQIEITAPP